MVQAGLAENVWEDNGGGCVRAFPCFGFGYGFAVAIILVFVFAESPVVTLLAGKQNYFEGIVVGFFDEAVLVVDMFVIFRIVVREFLPGGRIGSGQDARFVENVVRIFGKNAIVHGYERGRVGFGDNLYPTVEIVVYLLAVFGVACGNWCEHDSFDAVGKFPMPVPVVVEVELGKAVVAYFKGFAVGKPEAAVASPNGLVVGSVAFVEYVEIVGFGAFEFAPHDVAAFIVFGEKAVVIDEGFWASLFDGVVAVEDLFAVGPIPGDFLGVLQIEAWVGVDIPIQIVGVDVVADKRWFFGGHGHEFFCIGDTALF